MTNFTSLGICKVQFDPVCPDGTADHANRTALVACNIVNVDQNDRRIDSTIIEAASGVPGVNCVELEIPGGARPPEIVIDTCEVIDPEVEEVLSGGSREAMFATVNTVLQSIGIRAAANAAGCVCDCPGVASCNRWAITVWSVAFCPGATGGNPDAGHFAIRYYPNVEFVPQVETLSQTNVLNSTRRYLGISYESTGTTQWVGPQSIITAAEGLLNRWSYGPFLSAECPPGNCDCGGCTTTRQTVLAP